MPEPLVSIVTPSYNQGEFLEQAIQSVLSQDYPRVEYILIDGGSSDNSLEIIQRYSGRLAYWVSEPDRGQANAINKGLRQARGEILSWLNSDDVLLEGTVGRAVNALAQDEQIDVVYGRLERIDRDGRRVPTPLLPKDRVCFDREHAIGESVVNQPGCFWRRRIMEKAGLLNEDLHYAIDYEFWLRILLAGGRFKRLPDLVAQFRLSQHSKTVGQTARAAVEHLKVIDDFMADPDLAQKLNLAEKSLREQASKGRGIVSLYAFYGCAKQKRWGEALNWLARAHASDPAVLFNRRWLDLARAGLSRRLLISA